MTLPAVIITAALAQNVVLVHFLGIRPLSAAVVSPRRAVLLSGATTAALVWVTTVAWLLYRLLLEPIGLERFVTVMMALVVAVSVVVGVQLASRMVPFHRTDVHQTVPAVLLNATTFVVPMALVEQVPSYGLAIAGAISAGIGMLVALTLIAAVRGESERRRLPQPLRGDVMVYVGAAFLSLAIQQMDRLAHTWFTPLW